MKCNILFSMYICFGMCMLKANNGITWVLDETFYPRYKTYIYFSNLQHSNKCVWFINYWKTKKRATRASEYKY